MIFIQKLIKAISYLDLSGSEYTPPQITLKPKKFTTHILLKHTQNLKLRYKKVFQEQH